MKTIILFSIFVLLFCNHYSQNKYHIESYINPFSTNILNPNKDYNKVKHESINVEHKNVNTIEAGLNIIKTNPNKKIDLGLGLSYKNFGYEYLLYIDKHPLVSNTYSYYILRHRKFKFNTLGLKLIAGKKIFNNSRIAFIIQAYIPLNVEIEPNTINSDFSYITGYTGEGGNVDQSKVTIKETINPKIERKYTCFVPEINIQTKINKSFFLNYGTKVKVWSSYSYHEINVSGYYSLSEQQRTLYSSIINSKHFTFYFGILYRINLNKNKN